MSVRWNRVTEYDLECDQCGYSEVAYSGDSWKGRIVRSIPDAIAVCNFHRSYGRLLCDKCFRNLKAGDAT